MTRNLIRSLAAVAGLSVSLAACDGTGPERPSGVTLLLTDAPGNVDEAWVKIDRVYMQGTGGQTDLLSEQSKWIELTALAGETTETLVAGKIIPPGTYGQMRFIVTEALVIAKGGTAYATEAADFEDFPTDHPFDGTLDGVLHGPSFAQTGIKVNMPDGGFTVEGNEGTIIVVDFDVAESFGQQAGASGMWVMHPSLRATELVVSGNIRGDVALGVDAEDNPVQFPAAETCGGRQLAITDFVPQAVRGETKASGEVSSDGSYLIAYVHPVEYAMTYQPGFEFNVKDDDGTVQSSWKVAFEADPSKAEVTVPQAGSVTVDYTITGLTCEEIINEG
jgi:hypothetical protein